MYKLNFFQSILTFHILYIFRLYFIFIAFACRQYLSIPLSRYTFTVHHLKKYVNTKRNILDENHFTSPGGTIPLPLTRYWIYKSCCTSGSSTCIGVIFSISKPAPPVRIRISDAWGVGWGWASPVINKYGKLFWGMAVTCSYPWTD